MSLISKEILTILRKPITYIPSSIKISKPAKEFQFFEVLSAYMMSLIESDFEWTVTPLRRDHGVDFYGEKALVQIPGLEEPVRVVIAGQCKASQNNKSPLPSDLWKLLSTVNPAIVFIFSMSDISKRRVLEAQKLFSNQTHKQCQILTIKDVVRLIDLYRHDILNFLRLSLDHKDQGKLRAFIEQLPSVSSENIEVEIRSPEKALAGSPFYVHVNVHSVLLCQNNLRLRWKYPSSIMLIKPTELVSDEGLLLKCGESFCLSFAVKLISYHVGEISLGDLIFEVDGTPVKTVSLGSLLTIDQYHPIFFWKPFERQRARFVELLEKAEAYSPVGIAVVGQGGAGKTRFCQELGYFAEQRGAAFVSISHPQDLQHPYKIFGLLTQELLSNPFGEMEPKKALESYILSLHPELYKKAKGTIALIFSGDISAQNVFDRETMLQILLVILLRKAKSATHILHFSDLHWANTETLEILGDLLEQLKKMTAEYNIAVLFIFEGRVQTNIKSLQTTEIPGQIRSTAVFESFISRYQLEQFEIKPFNTSGSLSFLKHLFENTQSEHRSVEAELIPHQELLIKEIARYGQGNPFHMIEQIKLLKHEKTVTRNQRTGLIYLAEYPKSSYEVPTSVSELISLRLKFIEDLSPEIGLLIKSVAFIKDRIDAQLFRKLHQGLAQHTPESTIQQIEILNTDNLPEVGFRHENYFHVVQGATLGPLERKKITDIYLDWYDQLHPKTAERLYEEALVHTNSPSINTNTVWGLLNKGLQKAETSHQHQLATLIIAKLLKFFPPGAPVYSTLFAGTIADLKLRIKLAGFSGNLEDWSLGAEQLELVIARIDEQLQTATRLTPSSRLLLNYLRTTSMVELANHDTDLGKSHLSIRLLTEAREICESYFAMNVLRNPRDRDKWHNLYCRALNRLGEAQWMDGNYAESLLAQENATSAIDELIPQAETRQWLHHINFLDYGMVLLHKSPAKGVEMMNKSLSLVPARKWSPRYGILGEITLVIGEMVQMFLEEKGSSDYFLRSLENSCLQRLQQNFEKAVFYSFKQEQVASSLMLGICFTLLNDQRSAQWHMQSIEISFRSNNIESLWRGHLNLAQYLFSTGKKEAAVFHCGRALAILSKDLGKKGTKERKWRQRHLTHPLMRINDLLPEGIAADPLLDSIIKQTDPGMDTKSQPISDIFFSDKIIFLWNETGEYYTYGG